MSEFKPIKASELPLHLPTAAATSHEVSPDEFQQIAQRGQAHLDAMRQRGQEPTALNNRWHEIRDTAYAATRKPWGGATINPRTGRPVDFHKPDKHALTVREPGQQQISIPAGRSRIHFDHAMDRFKDQHGTAMGYGSHYVGVFHDADKGTVDIDPTVVVGDRKHDEARGRQKAQEISAATHATGGAYHFASGNGVWPPHVKG